MTQTNEGQKQEISHAEFDKKVDVARGHYEYIGRMSPQEARKEAVKEVSQKYVASAKMQ